MKGVAKKFIVGLALASMALVALAGCGSSGNGSSGDSENPNVGVFLLSFANSHSQGDKLGAEAAAKKTGANLTFFDGKFDGETQLKQIQDATASGKYDGFVIFANDGAIIAPAVEDAIKSGIKVVAAYTPIGPNIDTFDQQIDGLTATVANPISGNGTGLAQAAAEACKGNDDCNVAYVSGGFDIPFEALKFKAFEEELGKHGNMNLTAKAEAPGFLKEEGYKTAQDLLAAHDDIDVYVTSGDQMTFGAEEAMNDAGVPKGSIALIGNGGTYEAMDAIREGRWFADYVFMQAKEGGISVDKVVNAIRNNSDDYEYVDIIKDVSPVGAFVTKENVDKFTPSAHVG